ncbi:MgSsk1 [Candida margitis]|uniref:MgSsk1 n=1 Tax=Candida margitis TaxID=1775924 RepID=UPI002225D056|nr:MgSsk1 [Candida margitis]KAI5957044.1 MgSsk1 [Candida margitis]
MSHMYNSGDFAPPYSMKSPSINSTPRHSMSAPMSGASTSLNSTQNKYRRNDRQGSLSVDTSGGKPLNYAVQKPTPTAWASAYEDYNKPRRIWVKKPHGTPTTILAQKDDLVDDLKSQIIQKYPNSIGRSDDAANLTLKLVASDVATPDSSSEVQLERNGPIDDDIELEPDQNAWQVLDVHFPQGMGMKDAIIIESYNPEASAQDGHISRESDQRFAYSNQERPPLAKPPNDKPQMKHPQPRQADSPKSVLPAQSSSSQQLYTQQSSAQALKHFPAPKSSYTNVQGASFKDRSVSPSVTAAKNSPVPRTPSHSNFAHSPVQKSNPQAVLLLPKNFSINSNSGGSSSKSKVLQEAIGTNIHAGVNSDVKAEPALSEEVSDTRDKKDDVGFDSSPSPASNAEAAKTDFLPSLAKTMNSGKSNRPEKTSDPALDKVFPSISVLVVEDNAINQAILGAFLRKRKIHYQIAKNGQEAIDKWKKGGFHLVLMDIQLPVKSGIEATKEIRHLEKLNKIGVFDDTELSRLALNELQPDDKLDTNTFRSPVIIVALTASSNSSVDRKNALTAGCNDYLTKPVNLVWLQNKITEWGCMQALIDFEGWKGKKNWSTT